MSANNQLLITKREEKYVVTDIDVDTGSEYEVAVKDTLEEAIRSANRVMEDVVVEYGLRVDI
jgi:hypothetical protein